MRDDESLASFTRVAFAIWRLPPRRAADAMFRFGHLRHLQQALSLNNNNVIINISLNNENTINRLYFEYL